MNRLLFVCFVLSGSLIGGLNAQGYNIGIRAGISQSMFSGPSEANVNESFKLNNGFHFGINFQWNFNDLIGIRSEIMYNQIGSDYEFTSPDGYYIFDLVNNDRFVLRDNTEIQLSHSNAYISFPQTFHVSVGDRFEVFAGGLELANGFYELNDIEEQQSRMQQENARRTKHGKENIEPDEFYCAALQHGLPDCSGVAIGIDRLMMFITGEQSIARVKSFSSDKA